MGRDSLRTRWVRTEPTVHIVGEQHRRNQKNHVKLKRGAAEEAEEFAFIKRSWKVLPPDPIAVRTIIQGEIVNLVVPFELGRLMISRRIAGVVLNPNEKIDAVIEIDGLEQALFAFGLWTGDEPTITQEPSMITVKLLESVNDELGAGTVIRLPRETGEQLARFNIAVQSSEQATVFVSSEDLS